MDNQFNQILSGMVDIYRRQRAVYEDLYSLTQKESAAIEAGDTLALTELLQLEDELIESARTLESVQREMKELLLTLIPGNSLGMDRLACYAEPVVYISFKETLAELKEILHRIENQKNENIVYLAEKIKECQETFGLCRQGKRAVNAYGMPEKDAKILDIKQ